MIHRRNLLLAAILVIALHCPSFDCRPHDANRQTRSVGSSSDGHIFTARLGDEAPRNLGNPCGSSSRSSESSMGLGVSSGREAMLRGMAQNMLAAVRHLNASLQDPESCADLGLFASLPPMPNFALFPRESSSSTAFPSELLHAMYTSFHSLSAHFHFMRADWRRGRSCSARGAHSDIVFGVERLSAEFRDGMCSLMAPNEASSAAPYPTTSMLEAHSREMQQEIYHYYDCTGRMVRDCLVTSYATQLLRNIAERR